MKDRSKLLTERRLPESMDLDLLGTAQAVAPMHEQDMVGVKAVGSAQREIVQAVELVAERLGRGGRLFYVGAGSSGRLGVLDASECPPTFRTEPEMIQGIIAGGRESMFRAKEGAEDSVDMGAVDMDERGVCSSDVVMGIATGGTTPYVQGALSRAKLLGAATIFLSCVERLEGETEVNVAIRTLTGPEILTGSTRLKGGTATKLVLNMISTLAMVKLGKVYENLMVDMKASNDKLRDRAIRHIEMTTGVTAEQARELLMQAEGHVKLAILMHKRSFSADDGKRVLASCGGKLRDAIAFHG